MPLKRAYQDQSGSSAAGLVPSAIDRPPRGRASAPPSNSARQAGDAGSLIIFDFDGTLADTWDWLAEEVVAGAPLLGHRTVSREELEHLRAFSTREVFKKLGISWWRMPKVAKHLRSRAAARMAEIQLFDGASDLLEAVHATGSDIALVSSNSEAVIRHVLGARLMPFVKLMDCGGAVFGKASKLKRVLRKCGTNAKDAVFVGDETRDLDAADAAGVRGLGVEWGYAAPELLRRAAPGRTAASMEDLRRVLVALGRQSET